MARRRHVLPLALAVSVGAALAGPAAAQTIYRCGNTYTRVPCADGRALDIGNPGTAAQRAEGRQVAARERRLAEEMARDRRAAEASRKPPPAASLSPAPAASKPAADAKPKPRPKSRKTRPGETPSGDFIARPPAPAKRPPPS